jgi:hypothetical protein
VVHLRIGVLDIAAAAVVVIVLVLPPRESRVTAASLVLDRDRREAISQHQAHLIANPADGAVAEELAETLTAADYSDWALRVAGEASRHEQAPSRWRALRAVSSTHAERFEIKDALRWGGEALAACEGAGAACPEHERVRLRIYVEELKAGVDSGIDPKADPEGFRRAITGVATRGVTLKPPRDLPEEPAGRGGTAGDLTAP